MFGGGAGGGVFVDATYRGFPIQDDIVVLRILPAHVLFHCSQDQGHSWVVRANGHRLPCLMSTIDSIEGGRIGCQGTCRAAPAHQKASNPPGDVHLTSEVNDVVEDPQLIHRSAQIRKQQGI
jgi:hypothetical protein